MTKNSSKNKQIVKAHPLGWAFMLFYVFSANFVRKSNTKRIKPSGIFRWVFILAKDRQFYIVDHKAVDLCSLFQS
ncbi:MAG: hypothetical protein IJ411_00820, partial [Oscillospiraceae bacterium]|nr:hypothetical protein [Oscillospiraceae bacterium]